MDDDEYERRTEAASKAAAAAHDQVPESGFWGFESYGDAPGAMGGGVGGFLWFTTRDAMLDFIGDHLTFFSPGPASADHEAVAAEVQRIAAAVAGDELSPDEGMEQANAALRRFSQIRWWGPCDELLEGEGSFVAEVRTWWRAKEGNMDGGGEPIAPTERSAFLAALDTWGL
jgi:hypothetical protein